MHCQAFDLIAGWKSSLVSLRLSPGAVNVGYRLHIAKLSWLDEIVNETFGNIPVTQRNFTWGTPLQG